jgi:uncharacterized tellurite resistance protein B-like protein
VSLPRLLGLLGLGGEGPSAHGAVPGETDTVRRIAARLERLPPDRARRLAAFAYVLARVAQADLEIDASESAAMERIVAARGGLGPAEAALAVEIAKSQARLLGGTENYVVTREFRRLSSAEEREQLLECAYAVAAANGSISAVESAECAAIAEELGMTHEEALAVRNAFRDQLSLFQEAKRGG